MGDKMEKEIKKYFYKIEQKKITRKIINEQRYLKGILATMLIAGIALTMWLFKANVDTETFQGIIYLSTGFVGYMITFALLIYIFVENKEFDSYDVEDQKFYLLYLLKHYIQVAEGNKDYKSNKKIKLCLVSICRYYTRSLSRQRNIIRSHNPFKVDEQEMLIVEIRACFLDKIMGLINKQEHMKEIKVIVDILFNINVQGTVLLNGESNVDEVNNQIQAMVREYSHIANTLPIVKDSNNQFKLRMEFLSKVITRLSQLNSVKIILLTCIIIIAYVLLEWKVNSSINITSIFTILLATPPSLAIFVNNIDKRNKDNKD